MPEVFGVSMSKSELLARVGDMSQVAGIRLATLADGRVGVDLTDGKKGLRLTGRLAPFRFEIAPK